MSRPGAPSKETLESLCRLGHMTEPERIGLTQAGLNPNDYVAVEMAAVSMGLALGNDGSVQLQPAGILPASLVKAKSSNLLAGVNQQLAAQMLMETLGLVGSPIVRVIVKREGLNLVEPEEPETDLVEDQPRLDLSAFKPVR